MTPNLCPNCAYDQFAYLSGRWYCQGCWKPQDEPTGQPMDLEQLLDGTEVLDQEER